MDQTTSVPQHRSLLEDVVEANSGEADVTTGGQCNAMRCRCWLLEKAWVSEVQCMMWWMQSSRCFSPSSKDPAFYSSTPLGSREEVCGSGLPWTRVFATVGSWLVLDAVRGSMLHVLPTFDRMLGKVSYCHWVVCRGCVVSLDVVSTWMCEVVTLWCCISRPLLLHDLIVLIAIYLLAAR
jgi:hypothetical protein